MKEHYQLTYRPERKDDSVMFRSAAILSCGLCGEVLDGMGGPGNGIICKPCGDELRSGRLIGAVKWDR